FIFFPINLPKLLNSKLWLRLGLDKPSKIQNIGAGNRSERHHRHSPHPTILKCRYQSTGHKEHKYKPQPALPTCRATDGKWQHPQSCTGTPETSRIIALATCEGRRLVQKAAARSLRRPETTR